MIEVWSEGDADACMSEDLLTELAPLVARHPWWRARTKLILRLLADHGIAPPARILDAGCGWGVTLEALEKRGYSADGLDISRRALERLDRPGRRLIVADITQELPRDLEFYDAVLALDVIEHLDDDHAALMRLGQLLKPGGTLIVTVPALPRLYSEFDAIQGHRRRYTPDTLKLAFEQTGLRMSSVRWWGALLVPMLAAQRCRPQGRAGERSAAVYRRYLKLPHWPLSLGLELVFEIEAAATRWRLSRIGTSLIALAVQQETRLTSTRDRPSPACADRSASSGPDAETHSTAPCDAARA